MVHALLSLTLLAASGPAGAQPENPLEPPARCVDVYLDAVRAAVSPPRAGARARLPRPDDRAYERARRLTAPRALAEAERATASGAARHPMAPWLEARGGRLLVDFQLLGVRRAPRGAAVVAVEERYVEADGKRGLEPVRATYLVAPVAGDWRVVDRRAGADFDDAAVRAGYPGYWDEPAPPRAAAR